MPRALGVGLSTWTACLVAFSAATSIAPAQHAAASSGEAQQLAALGAAAWHADGWLGQGVKVAVLDTGFRDYRRCLGSALPDMVRVRSFRGDGRLEARDSQHGVLCAEIVHALAPRAQLLFANWDTEDPASFVAAVRWARSQGARVLTCSVIMPSWSDGEGGGAVHAQLDKLLDGDVLLFASAGNVAQRHWTGPIQPNADGWHEWRDGQTANALEPWGEERVSVELFGPLDCRCELLVRHADGTLVNRSPLHVQERDGQVWGRATVRFDPQPRVNYQVCVACPGISARDERRFHLVVLGGNLACSEARGSIPFPADGARVLAVGAVDEQGQRLPYSSCGPIGRRAKPDFAARVPYPSRLRERPFSGTSAAAPQAAALAALAWSKNPSWRAAQVTALLRAAASDLGPAGHDCETGHGLIRLPPPRGM
jgi:subtilisin family serine protease